MRPLIYCWHCYKDVGPPVYEFFCHIDLVLRFIATSCLMFEGKFLAGLRGFLLGVATCATCCRLWINLAIAVSTSSHVLRFTAEDILSRTIVLYSAQFVCGVCSRGAVLRVATVVLIVTMTGYDLKRDHNWVEHRRMWGRFRR